MEILIHHFKNRTQQKERKNGEWYKSMRKNKSKLCLLTKQFVVSESKIRRTQKEKEKKSEKWNSFKINICKCWNVPCSCSCDGVHREICKYFLRKMHIIISKKKQRSNIYKELWLSNIVQKRETEKMFISFSQYFFLLNS